MTRSCTHPGRCRGLTLIELMVALAIFAVLGVLSYRALAEASNGRTRLEENSARWRAIARAIQRVDIDLLQVLAPTASVDSNPKTTAQNATPPMSMVRAADGSRSELQFLRIDEIHGVRLVCYRLLDGRLDWLRWDGRDPIGEPQAEPLLDKVRDVRWSFLLNNRRIEVWPPDDDKAGLPDAVILELELPDVGVLTRLVALR